MTDTIESLRQQLAEAKAALEGMCYQYLPTRGGKLHHDYMSAGEDAFEVLGWPDSGQPLPELSLCGVDGCRRIVVYGWKDEQGACSRHYNGRVKK